MSHEFWDIVRDVAGGTIVLLLGVFLKRLLAEHDAKKQAEKDWRERVDSAIAGIERRRHPRSSTPRETNGVDKHDSTARGAGSRVRRPRSSDDE